MPVARSLSRVPQQMPEPCEAAARAIVAGITRPGDAAECLQTARQLVWMIYSSGSAAGFTRGLRAAECLAAAEAQLWASERGL